MEKIQKVLSLNKTLDKHRPIDQDLERQIWDRFRLDWNYHSNKIEGNSLTYGETKALILFNITAQGKPLKDHFEITGHNEAVNWVLDIVGGERAITENFIRELHTLILKEPYETRAITPEGEETTKRVQVGKYKSTNNHVKTQTGEIFRFATVEETPAKMTDLIDWYNKQITLDYNPILLATEFHYRFIRIHPFDDGNGRTVRILMNFILMRFGFPPVIIKDEQKPEYFSVLEQADAGDIDPFIEFVCDRLIDSQQFMLDAIEDGNVPEDNNIEKRFKLLDAQINEISSGGMKSKNAADINYILTNTGQTIHSSLKAAQEKFSVYYQNFNSFIVDKRGNHIKSLLNINAYNSTIELINFRNLFKEFCRKNIDKFNYYSDLELRFNENEVQIVLISLLPVKSTEYEEELLKTFNYGSLLDEDEISHIVERCVNKHLDFIEVSMKDI